MIVIRFPDKPTERRALGYLAGRFSFTTWQTGEVLVPETALANLAVEGLHFQHRFWVMHKPNMSRKKSDEC